MEKSSTLKSSAPTMEKHEVVVDLVEDWEVELAVDWEEEPGVDLMEEQDQEGGAEEDIALLKFYGWDLPRVCSDTLHLIMLLKKGAEKGLDYVPQHYVQKNREALRNPCSYEH
ncbi:unnamed protein product [Fraxinus pennsylvanica]|uniref:Uncharacterized protein n=1 Tax=Fraxinus pennsylvanica TaxID=56036 RepID=A0AAD1ZST8_9LAMI|nr:unnamed protein product [Fraxinus pennsylvanica]